MQPDVDRLMHHIEIKIDLSKAAEGPASYWAALPLCVIDSVWSIQADYKKHVLPLIHRFCQSQQPSWKEEQQFKPTTDTGPTIQEFVDLIDRQLNSGCTYEKLFGNLQRTSSRSGILKAEAVHLFAKALLQSGINSFSDLQNRAKLDDAEKRVKEIPGQGSGITFTYFLMLAGEENFVKSDTHIRRFVSDALCIDWGHLVSQMRAEEMVRDAAKKFSKHYTRLTPAKLDLAIWNYQQVRTKPSPTCD
jgi:hypothetical protein